MSLSEPKLREEAYTAKHVRKFVFDHFLQHSQPPVLEEVMQKFKLDRLEAHGILQQLDSAHHLKLLSGTQRILMAWPFSAIVTPFRVTLPDARRYFANCAWDAVAFHVMLKEDVSIDSFCHHCAEHLQIKLRAHQIESIHPEGVLVYLALPAAKWWDDIVNTCSNHMTFFQSRAHLGAWLRANPGETGEAVTIEQIINLSVPIYGKKMELDYERPSKDELNAHFKSLGLEGNFWKL